MLRAAILLVLLCAACGDSSSGSGSSDDAVKFRDTKGRQCSTKRLPPVATCNVPAAPSRACAEGSTTCFVISVGQIERTDAGLTGPTYVRNCDSCCSEGTNASSNVITDCVPIACTTPSDCLGEQAQCTDGKCVAAR